MSCVICGLGSFLLKNLLFLKIFIFLSSKIFYMSFINKVKYPCSQGDVYSVLDTAWANFLVHLARFSAFKAKYILTYQSSALAAIAAARAMPDDDARSGASELLHIELVNFGKVCLQNFQFLKAYIDGAYADAAVRKVQYVIAGQNYYRGASQGNWEDMVLLNTNGENYLALPANVAALSAGGNMPASFVASQKTAGDDFYAKYEEFKLVEETSVETANKIKANNACYETGMDMMKDAQVIFMNEPEILTKFVFSNLLDLINPPVAGVKGTVKEAVTFEAIGNAVMTAQREGEPAEVISVDLEGNFSKQLSTGIYRINVSAIGFVNQTFEFDLKLTGLKKLDVEMVRVV